MSKHQYMTVTVPGTKKVSICSRRIGTRDRLSVIATSNDEVTAEKIVDALNCLQGQMEKLETPLNRVVDELKASLKTERDRAFSNAAVTKNEIAQYREKERQDAHRISTLAHEVTQLKIALDAAQKLTRETA